MCRSRLSSSRRGVGQRHLQARTGFLGRPSYVIRWHNQLEEKDRHDDAIYNFIPNQAMATDGGDGRSAAWEVRLEREAKLAWEYAIDDSAVAPRLTRRRLHGKQAPPLAWMRVWRAPLSARRRPKKWRRHSRRMTARETPDGRLLSDVDWKYADYLFGSKWTDKNFNPDIRTRRPNSWDWRGFGGRVYYQRGRQKGSRQRHR